MFRGQFTHALDQKGRVSVPARFRDLMLKDGNAQLILTPSPFDPCLHLYSLSAWEEFERKMSQLPSHDPRTVKFRRLYVSPALECELDRTGRIRIPQDFVNKAGLTKDVLFAGMVHIVELWAKDAWDVVTRMSAEEQAAFREEMKEFITI